MIESRLESMLQAFFKDESEDLPEAQSRMEVYLQYLLKGGKLENLPSPCSRVDQYLYALCERGFSNTSETTNAYTKEVPVFRLDNIKVDQVKPCTGIPIREVDLVEL